MAAADVAIPIAFPNFLIHVETPPMTVPVPEFIPGVGNQINIPGSNNKVPNLGHAGILFLSGQTGLTKYYEYGRYDPQQLGVVKNRRISDVKVTNGRPSAQSLTTVLAEISGASGQRGPIVAAYIELQPGAFQSMWNYANSRDLECRTNPNRPPYALFSNSCNHFMRSVAVAGGANMPTVIDPRPIGYLGRVREVFHDLDFKYPKSLSSTLMLM
jgi:hypothetical protein